MIKKGNRYCNEIFPDVIYIDMDDSEHVGDTIPELTICITLARLFIENGVETPHANSNNIGELCKFLKEFTEEVEQAELPECIVNYKPAATKAKKKSSKTSPRQKDIQEVKRSLFK